MRPDADALGSSLALMNFLEILGHDVLVVAPTEYPQFLKWLPGNINVVIDHSETREHISQFIVQADFLCCLDFNCLPRIGELGELVRKASGTKILIDHHLQPEGFHDFALWNPKASSTAELIYDFIDLFNKTNLINKDIATCIYAGIMTDTGSFRYPNTSAKVHHILADLIEKGIEHSEIHRKIYDDNRADRLRLLGYALSNKLKVFPEYHTAYISLSYEELMKFNYKQGDTEGIVNYALSIHGIIFAIIVLEKEDLVKMSFRSVGDFDVNTFARSHFNGGGHHNAAGGKSDYNFAETINKIEALLPKYSSSLAECHNKLNK